MKNRLSYLIPFNKLETQKPKSIQFTPIDTYGIYYQLSNLLFLVHSENYVMDLLLFTSY